MVDYEFACKTIDDLVKNYEQVSFHPALREHTTERMFEYVNGLGGEAGNHKQKLIRDYLRRTSLIDKLALYKNSKNR
jgi:hypothetical protein